MSATITTEARDLARKGRALARARDRQHAAAEATAQSVRTATAAGVSEVEAAKLAGVDRMTVRRWLGKR